MDFSLSTEQELVRRTFFEFAKDEIRPIARKLDEEPQFPMALFQRVAGLGFFGMRYPEPYGTHTDLQMYLLAVEELAWGSLSVAASCTMQSLMGTHFLFRFASQDIRERLFLPALLGQKIGTICMTEPDAGSDLLSMKTRAEETNGTYRISGSKTWITSAPVADFFSVFARTGEKSLGVFLLERNTPGVTIGKPIHKSGVRSSLTSEVFFDSAEATCVLGMPDQGISYLREILTEVRIMTAGLALGIARAAYEDAREWARQRRQFGKPIEQHQSVAAQLTDMATQLEAARHLVQYAAWRNTLKLPCTKEASMAKLFASEAAHFICDHATRIVASHGFSTESAVQRYHRDVQFLLFGGGTSEVLRFNIAREL